MSGDDIIISPHNGFFSELNSIESTESVEFVEDYF